MLMLKAHTLFRITLFLCFTFKETCFLCSTLYYNRWFYFGTLFLAPTKVTDSHEYNFKLELTAFLGCVIAGVVMRSCH